MDSSDRICHIGFDIYVSGCGTWSISFQHIQTIQYTLSDSTDLVHFVSEPWNQPVFFMKFKDKIPSKIKFLPEGWFQISDNPGKASELSMIVKVPLQTVILGKVWLENCQKYNIPEGLVLLFQAWKGLI